ncbi:MAG: hypothetical protein ACRDRF_19410 [Pseudonocardiaceae bacterium]
MAGAVYSAVLARGTFTVTGGDLLFHVPVGETWVVRDVAVVNASGSTVIVALYHPSDVSNIYRNPALADGAFDHWVGRQVVEQDEDLNYYTNFQPVRFCVSGYKFIG